MGAGVGEGRVIDLLSTDIEGSSPGRPGIVDIVPSHKAYGLESPGLSIETIKDILFQCQYIFGEAELIAYSDKESGLPALLLHLLNLSEIEAYRLLCKHIASMLQSQHHIWIMGMDRR